MTETVNRPGPWKNVELEEWRGYASLGDAKRLSEFFPSNLPVKVSDRVSFYRIESGHDARSNWKVLKDGEELFADYAAVSDFASDAGFKVAEVREWLRLGLIPGFRLGHWWLVPRVLSEMAKSGDLYVENRLPVFKHSPALPKTLPTASDGSFTTSHRISHSISPAPGDADSVAGEEGLPNANH